MNVNTIQIHFYECEFVNMESANPRIIEYGLYGISESANMESLNTESANVESANQRIWNQ